ncbi:hypothetical protein ABS71_22830 [bacterium SCN 62-11]|nr:hypothetical protein [Candidatus Eremiobacteraeota bacterium]ODT55502.1 MAG: hypothetical protein ABS71_22830 [bacterium SCN 62-11]
MRFRILLLAFTCLGLASAYLSWMLYECTPGRAALPPEHYPGTGALPRLILFLHPRCPCSRATVDELTQIGPLPQLEIVLSQASSAGALKAQFPQAELVSDPEGIERELYHAWTSGQLVGYSADGRLGFCGGITASRGQRGASLGRAHLLAWLHGQPQQQASVFGCPLVNPDEMCSYRQGTGLRNQ